jgi:hypothetical protein
MDLLPPEIASKVRAAVGAWERIAGVKRAQEGGPTAISWDQFGNFVRLQALLKEDTTGGIALVCCLEELADEVADSQVPLKEFLGNPSESTRAKIGLLSDVRAITGEPLIVRYREAVGDLVAGVLAALEIGADRQAEVAGLIRQPEFGEVLQKAGRWILAAEKHQLTAGEARGDAFRLNTWVYAFTNIDHAVQAVLRQPVDGLTLCLILDHPLEYSFFALGLKVGERVFIFHERTGIGHRDQLERRRNPGRDLERRLQNNFFPYESAFKFREVAAASGSGTQFRVSLGKQTSSALVLHDDAAHRLLRVAELDPYEVLWLVLLAYRLREDYWVSGVQLPQLSYVGSMVSLALPSGQPATTAIALHGNRGLDLATPSLDDVMGLQPGDYSKVGWDHRPSGHNIPLLATYADALNPGLLWGEEKLLLGAGGKDTREAAENGRFGFAIRGTHLGKFGDTTGFDVQLAEGHLLANREKIVALQLHEGRKRVAKALQAALNRDFNQNYNAVAHWLQDRANSRVFVDRVRGIAATGRFDDLKVIPQTFGSIGDPKCARQNVVQMIPPDKVGMLVFGTSCAIALYHPMFEAKDGPRQCCVQRGKVTKSTLTFVQIKPTTAAGLAELLGVAVDELPRGLRNFMRARPYIGNTILDHLDPLDLVENPWNSLGLQVSFYVSNRALEGWRRALAEKQPLPPCPAKVWVTGLDFGDRASAPPV